MPSAKFTGTVKNTGTQPQTLVARLLVSDSGGSSLGDRDGVFNDYASRVSLGEVPAGVMVNFSVTRPFSAMAGSRVQVDLAIDRTSVPAERNIAQLHGEGQVPSFALEVGGNFDYLQ